MKQQTKYNKTLSCVIPMALKDLMGEGDCGALAKKGGGVGFMEEEILEVALGG